MSTALSIPGKETGVGDLGGWGGSRVFQEEKIWGQLGDVIFSFMLLIIPRTGCQHRSGSISYGPSLP